MNEWYREVGGVYANTQRFGRKVFVGTDSDAIDSMRSKFNNTDMYVTMYWYKTQPQSESRMTGPLYLDFDAEDYKVAQKDALTVVESFKNDFKISPNKIKIYFSGSKGFHIVIDQDVFGIFPKKLLNEDYKKIANYFYQALECKTIDRKIYDTVRLFRVVNSINSKSGLYKIQITQEELKNLSYQEMCKLAASPREEWQTEKPKVNPVAQRIYSMIINIKEAREQVAITHSIKTNTEKVLPCILAMLEEGAPKGQRNNTVIILASALLQAKESIEEVNDVLCEWNYNYNDEPLSQNEILTTIHSAHRQIQQGRAYGCNTIKQLGLCVKDCPINRG